MFVYALLFVILGLAFGSFGSVLVSRIPQGKSLLGRSRCTDCNKHLTPLELIPILSYLVLRGRCKGCSRTIQFSYPALETGSALLFLYVATLHAAAIPALILALALWLLLVISIIDLRIQTISDLLNIPLIIVGFAYSTVTLQFSPWAIVIGAGFFGALWLVSRGKWIGSGDILLGAGIGALLGSPERVVVFLFLTYIVGALIVCLLLLLRVVKTKSYIAFAPLLSIATLLTIVFEDRIEIVLRLYFGV